MSNFSVRCGIFKFAIDNGAFMRYNRNMITVYLTKCDKSRSHDFLFTVLEKEYGVRADESGLIKSPHGKLSLLDSGVHFNISHSGEYIAVAVGKKHDLGIDIEKIKDADKSKLAKKYFGAEPQTPEQFYTLWTKAESFIKYRAGSIAAELKKITIDGDDIYYEGELQPVQSKTIRYEDYVISVTSKDTDLRIIDCGTFEY